MKKYTMVARSFRKMRQLENTLLEGFEKSYISFFEYTLETTAYPGLTAFVVYYKYNVNGKSSHNLITHPDELPRFFRDNATGKITNIIKYQRYCSEKSQEVLFLSVGNNISQESAENIKYYIDNRKSFSKKTLGYSAREKRISVKQPILEPIKIPEIIPVKIFEAVEDTVFTEVEILEPEINKGINKNNKPKNVRISKVKLPIKASSGLRNLIKSKGKVAA